MFKAATDPEPGTNSDQLQLLRLNRDFLKLLHDASCATQGSTLQQLALRADRAATLSVIDASGLDRMAACGFSLFSLSLHRPDLWQQAVQRCESLGQDQYYGSNVAAPAQAAAEQFCSGFVECALFFAWHLVQQHSSQARLLLGLCEDCAVLLSKLDLWQCRYIAQTQQRLLSPRWRHHPYFWSDLLRYGSTGDQQYLKFAQLLGSQLLAQELEPSVIMSLSKVDRD